MDPRELDHGSVIIKNKTGSPYTCVEMAGHVIAPGASVDMLDDDIEHHYSDYQAAHRCVAELATAKLRQDIIKGDVEVVTDRAPSR